jgi:hypothetical protein
MDTRTVKVRGREAGTAVKGTPAGLRSLPEPRGKEVGRLAALALAAITVALPRVAAAESRINVDFPELAAKAVETVDVTLDGAMLRLGAKFLGDGPDERTAREVISKLTGVYVRSYQFEKDGDYDRKVVERVRAQLGPSWKRIVKVVNRKSDDVGIYVDMKGEEIVGLVIISAEPRELTVVNLVGPLDLDKLASLEGQLGIPRILGGRGKDRSDAPKKPTAPEKPAAPEKAKPKGTEP